MTPKKTLRLIKKIGDLTKQIENAKSQLAESEFFEDLYRWEIVDIYYNCKIKDGVLYAADGSKLSADGCCMDEEIPYFVNQSTGYCGDDYYGTMYVRVGDLNTFVAIQYEC